MKLLKAIVLLLLLDAMLQASGFMLSGVGSEGLGMAGGGYRAAVSGWSSIFWNPSGLANSASSSIELYLSLVLPEGSFEPHTGILGYDGPYSMRYKVNAERQIFKIPAFGVFYSADGQVVDGYGFAFFAPFGLGASYDLYDPPIGYYVTDDTSFVRPEFPEHDWVSDLKVTAAWAGIAKKLSDRLSVGISGGPIFASVYFRKVDFIDPAEVDSNAVNLPIQYRLWPVDVQLSGSGLGAGFGLGIQYKLNDKFSLGFSGRYYAPLKLEGQDSLVVYFPRNDALASMDSAAAFLFSGATMPSFTNGTARLPLPWSVGIGAAYRPSDRLTLGFDIELNGHSVVKYVPIDFDSLVVMDQRIEAETLKLCWHNAVRLSAGASYTLPSAIVLRGGVYFESSPIPDSTFTPLIADTGDKLSLNLGITVPLTANISVSANMEAMLVKSRDVVAESDFSYRSNYLPGKYTSSVKAAGLSLAYKF